MDQFKKWFGDKLGITIGNYIGGGVEGEIYEIDKYRVIKFGYSNVSSTQYLSSRNLDGIVKIFQTGIIDAPKRFKGGSKPDDYTFNGIDLLGPERTSGPNDYEIGYTIMEKLYPSKDLESKLKFLDNKLWFKFTKIRYERSSSGVGSDKIFGENDYSIQTNKIIKDSSDGFGRFLLKTLFKNASSDIFIKDLRNFLMNLEPFTFEISNKEKTFDGKFKKEIIEIFDRLVVISKNVKKVGMDWGDVHSQQFAYNSKGEVTAFDIDFGMGSFDRDTEEFIYPPNKKEADSKKVKNVIREFRDFK